MNIIIVTCINTSIFFMIENNLKLSLETLLFLVLFEHYYTNVIEYDIVY